MNPTTTRPGPAAQAAHRKLVSSQHTLASRPSRPARRARPAAETAPCTCPEFCERDHDRD